MCNCLCKYLWFLCANCLCNIVEKEKILIKYKPLLLYLFVKYHYVRPTFFYFFIYGSADPNFWRNEIKIKEAKCSFIFLLSADLMNSLPCKIKLPRSVRQLFFDRFTFQMKSSEHVSQLKIESVFICQNTGLNSAIRTWQLTLQNYRVVNQSKRTCLYVLT